MCLSARMPFPVPTLILSRQTSRRRTRGWFPRRTFGSPANGGNWPLRWRTRALRFGRLPNERWNTSGHWERGWGRRQTARPHSGPRRPLRRCARIRSGRRSLSSRILDWSATRRLFTLILSCGANPRLWHSSTARRPNPSSCSPRVGGPKTMIPRKRA